jgi:hypothetical protein
MINPIPETSIATWGEVPETMWEVNYPKMTKWIDLKDLSFANGSIIRFYSGWEGKSVSYHHHFQPSQNYYVDMEVSSEAILANFKKHIPNIIIHVDSCSPYQDEVKATENEPVAPKKFTGWKRSQRSDGNWMPKRK